MIQAIRFEGLSEKPTYKVGDVICTRHERMYKGQKQAPVFAIVRSATSHYERGDGWDTQGWVASLQVEVLTEDDPRYQEALKTYKKPTGLWG